MVKNSVTVHSEKVVCQGKPYEDMIWGEYQFPHAYYTTDGEISVCVHVHDDDAACYGLKDLWCVTKDGGKNWKEDMTAEQRSFQVKLPGGDMLTPAGAESVVIPLNKTKPAKIATETLPSDPYPPVKEKDGSMPWPDYKYIDIFDQTENIYNIDNLPEGLMEKKFPMRRIKKGETEGSIYYADIKQNFMGTYGCVRKDGMVLIRPFLYGNLIVTPDNKLWAIDYKSFTINPFNGGAAPYASALYYRSDDDGKSFELISHINYVPDNESDRDAFINGGYDEPCMTVAPDGTYVSILRTADVFYGGREWAPCYISYSYDKGCTWTKPERFDDKGVLPNILTLKNGITVAAYGRPGIYIRIARDKGARNWEAPVEIMTAEDRSHLMNNPPKRPDFHQWCGSCCNVNIIPVDDNKILLLYSDFFYPDINGSGKKLKTILSRLIEIN